MTYQQAYDKIIQAYFRDEIKPLDAKFCFCGTLCDNSDRWMGTTDTFSGSHHLDSHGYIGDDFVRMETALLITLRKNNDGWYNSKRRTYEDALFAGMTTALEVLKQIHRERGEDVDSLPALTKRNLKTTVQ